MSATETVPAQSGAGEGPERSREALDVSVLIHVVDLEADVKTLLKAYRIALDALHRTYEVIFVLDGVAGRLLMELEEIQQSEEDVKILALQGKGNGESIAYRAATPHARGRYLITATDYLQVDPRSLEPLLSALDAGADLVTSWRWPRIDPLLNRLQSGFFNRFLRLLSKVELHDLNCNFRALRREVLEEISIYGDMFRFLPILATKRGFQVKEVKVRHLEERGKTGFFGFGVYFRRLLDILAVTFLARFTRKPLRFFGIIGLALFGLGVLLAAPPIVERIFEYGGLQNRPIFLMGVVLISFGLQFIGFGLVGEIIIFTQSRNMRDYKIQKIVSSDPAARVEAAPVLDGEAVEVEVAEPAPRSGLSLRHPAPGEDPLLDDFVERHPKGTFFHLSYWRKMVEELQNRHTDIVVTERDGQITGMLPIFDCDSIFLGKVSVSMPFAVYGGIVADDAESAGMLFEEAAKRSRNRGRRYLELRQRWELELPESFDLELQKRDLYIGFEKELPEDPAECLTVIPRKARAEARRGRDKSGLRFEPMDDLRAFHRLFAENKQGLGSPCLPLSMLRMIERHLGDRVIKHQITLEDGTVIAAVMSFVFRDEILPYYSGALAGYSKTGVNNYMYWKLMEWAVEQGLRRFDFGRSRADTGAAKFKKNMGFEGEPLHYLFALGDGVKMPEFHPSNPKLSIYKRMWTKLPKPVARVIGGKVFTELP
jgi:FemAB-related protein (PEP-CTERM system-associated)